MHILTIRITRLIESLGAKVHSTPPSIDRLSEYFQDFYLKAESHIATHINALSSLQYRGTIPNAVASSKISTPNKEAKKPRSMSSRDTLDSVDRGSEQQMLTPEEISERRKARRMLQRKKLALEEAVERRVCEKVYSRIWRHRSTLDEVRDEKLRSRTAALALVGIDLQDLGINIDTAQSKAEGSAETVKSQVEDWILKAREGLLKMTEAKHPLGKLQHLASAHKCIVDFLTDLHQSSSSADEILPTLIYTLITTPPEGINVISNLHFIQRFRAAGKIDGESAYCLTNLEAAITFLETVDLATLRESESLEGPPKSSSRPSTPRTESRLEWASRTPVASTTEPAAIPATEASTEQSPPASSHPLQSPPPLASPSHQRRLSHLFQPPVSALGAASDAVRNTADQGLKNIGNTLDNSFKFLFGRLKEQQLTGSGIDGDGNVILPKTLEDARALMEPKSGDEDEDGMAGAGIAEERPIALHESKATTDDALLSVFAGRKQTPRDRSTDSIQSSGSGKRVAFATEVQQTKEKAGSPSQLVAMQHETAQTANTAVESMRNLGNSLNPLNRFAGMNVMRGFGRTISSNSVETKAIEPVKNNDNPQDAAAKAGKPITPTEKIAPPVQRFMNVTDAGELKLNEVAELLKDYKRLAAGLKQRGEW